MRDHLRRIRRAALVLLFGLVTALGLIPAGTAQAASGCSGGVSWLFGFASFQCQSGSYAVTARCQNWLGYQTYAQGPRVWAPATSTVSCPGGYRPISGGYIIYS